MERPNTVSGLTAKRDELVALRKRLQTEIKAITLDIEHIDAAIRIFDPENSPEGRRRYAALHSARFQASHFVLRALREAREPLTVRKLADLWCVEHELEPTSSTLAMLRKRLASTMINLRRQGVVEKGEPVDGLNGWRVKG